MNVFQHPMIDHTRMIDHTGTKVVFERPRRGPVLRIGRLEIPKKSVSVCLCVRGWGFRYAQAQRLNFGMQMYFGDLFRIFHSEVVYLMQMAGSGRKTT